MVISPQSVSSMAQFSGEQDDFMMFKKLQTVFKQLGARMVLEMSAFTAMALELSYQEFKQKYLAVNGQKVVEFMAN